MASNPVRMGETVIYTARLDEPTVSGAAECPAIVTRVHGPDMVNLRLLQDGPAPSPRGGLLTLEELARAGEAYERREREGLARSAEGKAPDASQVDLEAWQRGEIVDLGTLAFVDVPRPLENEWRQSVPRGEGPGTWRSIGA